MSLVRTPPRPPIAIIGMAARLPGARDLEEFWSNLREGRESITHGSPLVVCDETSGRRWVYARGVLDDPGRFDADFFGIPRPEAELLDPQHRCLLECAWTALEDAGYDPHRLSEPVAVYTTSGPNTYLDGRDVSTRSAADRLLVQLSNIHDTLPTRISYKLGLTGESVNVQTACSSALVAVHLACEALRDGRADMALVGAVNVRCWSHLAYEHQDGFILSADGHTRPYDHAASGYVEGDGAGSVVLRRLADALERGDQIHAVVSASAVNNDGRAKVGFSAPSVEGQARVIRSALEDSGLPAESIGLVEGHGTGTPVGDPIEVRALTRAFRAFTRRSGFCALGSVKANIGHLGFAAGMAGLMKAVLCVRHGELPPEPAFEEPNPEIDFAASPFFVNRELRPWRDRPRRAGVSSFGMGGTNAHVVIEQAPEVAVAPSRSAEHAVLLSARTEAALGAMKRRLGAFAEAHPTVDLADLAFTLATGRRPLAHRWAAVVASIAELRRALERGADGVRVFESGPDDEASAHPGASELAELAGTWSHGAPVEWDGRYAGERRRRLSLPTYPWQGERLWLEETAPRDPLGDGALREPEEQAPPAEWLYRQAWRRTSLPPPYRRGDLAATGGSCLVLGDGRRLSADLLAELAAAGRRAVLAEPGARFEVLSGERVRVRPGEPGDLARLVAWTVAEAGPIEGVVHMWSYGRPAAGQPRGLRLGVLSLLFLVQAAATNGQAPEILVVTENAQPAQGDARRLHVEAAALLGLCRVLPQEHPAMACRCVDFGRRASRADVVERLLAEMANPQDEPEIVYRGRDRMVGALERIEAQPSVGLPLRAGGVYLVTGGSGRIGLAIAEHLARARARLALVSRRGLGGAADGVDRESALRRLRHLGAEPLVLSADVADERQMARAVHEVNARWGPINGVVHTAGIEESRNFMFIAETTEERAHEVLRPKVPGIAVVDRVTRSQPLDFCLVCSSLNSLLGGLAYGVYTAANRYLDSYAHWRRAAGAPWVSVNWDTWRFSESGAARIGAAAARTSIRPEQGVALLGPIVAAAEPQVVVSTIPLAERTERIRRAFAARRTADAEGSAPTERADVSREELGGLVGRVLSDLVGVPDLTDDDELLAVGCDSLTLLQAVARLERALGARVPIERLWGCTTVGDLAETGWRIVSDRRDADGDVGTEALRYLAG